ncbi:aromatic ring-hydroxylating dioxygenase subunit alpha [Paracoccus sp. CPCC 101403]|uniref:Aromatic ring-hydroxylating dioxygenase subunit alpha n=1 Tax=Paracoccus broussonetiae TaxID=3075834 RepID=A0ABU3EIM9_9RHOB|nr:aromatic ring-hydroxylating dioxygenase subunit alpha [Paracoccus sp. CPCC 101403]MDT1064108.1 aromatic ring-hydroxylating dioxygenase subunit alpha [Paracoccus sp. CPCC 101403]
MAVENLAKINAMNDTLREIAALPEHEAQCLPGRFYTDPDYFRYEVETFLSREWHALGRADEIPKPGDYFVTQLFDEPLLVVRGDDEEVRILSNLCRHRGMPLVEGVGSTRRFVCAYHAWTYGGNGQLINAPRMRDKGVTEKNCSLPTFRCEIWNGFIYVNLDDDAAPLAPRLGQLENMLGNYDPSRMRIVRSFEEDWHTNWKCLVENFMEAYHLSVVHPETLHPYTPTGLSRKSMSDDSFTSYCANYPETAASRGAGAPGLTDDERKRSTLFNLFPTQIASQAATLLVSFSIKPLAVDRIRVRWTMSTYGDELTQDELEERIALWHEVNREDREKLEKMQRALASRHAPSGQLAPRDYEGTIWDFYRYLGRQIPSVESPLRAVSGG